MSASARLLALLSLPLVLVPPCLRGQTAIRLDSASIIETSGSGIVNLSPDRASIRLNVESRDTSAAAAAAANNTRLHRVVDALEAAKAPQESVQVVAVSVRVNQAYQTGALRGYIASAVVRVSIRSLDRLGTVVDRALGAGATGVAAITFASDRQDAARQQALALAFQEARSRAEAVARAANVRLGPLVRIVVERRWGFGEEFAQSGVDVGALYERAIPIAPQDVTVRESVQAQWRLELPR